MALYVTFDFNADWFLRSITLSAIKESALIVLSANSMVSLKFEKLYAKLGLTYVKEIKKQTVKRNLKDFKFDNECYFCGILPE